MWSPSVRLFRASSEAVGVRELRPLWGVQRCALVCHKLARGAPSEGVGGFFLTLSRWKPRGDSLHTDATFFQKANLLIIAICFVELKNHILSLFRIVLFSFLY